MKNAQTTLDGYESKAISLTEEMSDLESRFRKVAKDLQDFSEIDYTELEDNEEEVAYLKKNASALAETLKGLKRNLASVKEQMESVTQEYEKLKKQTLQIQKQYKEYKEKYEAVVASRGGEVKEIQARLCELEKDISGDLLERYKNKRKEGLWPVLSELNDNRCSICSMDLPRAAIAKLGETGVIECENCHRLIFKK